VFGAASCQQHHKLMYSSDLVIIELKN